MYEDVVGQDWWLFMIGIWVERKPTRLGLSIVLFNLAILGNSNEKSCQIYRLSTPAPATMSRDRESRQLRSLVKTGCQFVACYAILTEFLAITSQSTMRQHSSSQDVLFGVKALSCAAGFT